MLDTRALINYGGEKMKNKTLDLVYRTHGEGKEKIVFLRDFVLKHDRTNFYENIQDTLEFFYKHIPLHFAYEEVVINALLKNNKLTRDQLSNIDRIMQEHIILKKNFEKLKEMSTKIGKRSTKEQREDFLCIVNETVEALIKHAEYEDQYLYPVAEMITDDVVLSIVEKEMSKIVY